MTNTLRSSPRHQQVSFSFKLRNGQPGLPIKLQLSLGPIVLPSHKVGIR